MRIFRALRRAATLTCLSAPIAVLLPLTYAFRKWYPSLEDALWDYILWAVEKSGPTFIKLAQWASTREDLFPAELTRRFVKLQDDTKPHRWHETERTLVAAYGEGWRSVLRLDDHRPIGSGCIAQVYRGYLVENGEEVAVKVLHPGVRDQVEGDMDLMHFMTAGLELVPRLNYLSIRETLGEFHSLLVSQMDLRNESYNLQRLNEDFKEDPRVLFPRPYPALSREELLVESFVHGTPILQYLSADDATKKKICEIGAQAVFAMSFTHNFMHGDLHPGNILVVEGEGGGGPAKLCFLDAGIVVELSKADHTNMIKILGAFIMREGERAGHLMVDQGYRKQQAGRDACERGGRAAQLFAEGIDAVVQQSRDDRFFDSVGSYCATFFGLACTYKVKLEAKFMSVAMATKIMEGIVSELNPDIDMVTTAIPFLLQCQMKYGLWQEVLRLKDIYRGLLSAEKVLAAERAGNNGAARGEEGEAEVAGSGTTTTRKQGGGRAGAEVGG